MYTDNLIRKWNFEQIDLLDMREVLYQEALAECEKLKQEVAFWKVRVDDWKRIYDLADSNYQSAAMTRDYWYESAEAWRKKYECATEQKN